MASKQLNKEIKGLAIVIILVVVFSIVLNKFNDIEGGTCGNGYVYNQSAGNCYLSTNASDTAAISEVGESIATGITALQEPIAWIAIIVIIIVVAWLLSYLNKNKQM